MTAAKLQAAQRLTYDQNRAGEILKYAIISYCDVSLVKQWTCGPLCNENILQNVNIFYNKSHDSFAFTGFDPNKNAIIASFRGSENSINALYDLDFPKEVYPNCADCFVHNGLYKEYLSLVSNGVIQEVKQLRETFPQAKMIVTGHSLGAAMATFAALDIQKDVTDVDEFYTFGCPRLGNNNLVAYIESSLQVYYRLVHFKDPIPQLPLQSMGFYNPGVEVWYENEEGSSYIICENGESELCSDQFILSGFKLWNLGQHFEYLNMTIGPSAC